MDVESFEEGILAAIVTDEGETQAVGAPIGLLALNEADVPALQAYAEVCELHHLSMGNMLVVRYVQMVTCCH